jgi:1-pyrroline-5-carboxylate dehydrogenase
MLQVPKPNNETVLSYAPASSEKKLLKTALKDISEQITEIPLIIGGKHTVTRAQQKLCSPHAKQKVIANYSIAEEKDVQAAIQNATETQKTWSRVPFQERASVFLKAADLLATQFRPKINAATMLGQSKSCHQAEIDAACELIDFFRFNVHFAQQIYAVQPPHSPRGVWNRSEARALEGFVYAVGPFNFTSISVNLATAPALMGCCVLWKPAATALLSSYLIYEILEKAGLPPGVINLVSGDAGMISKTVFNNPHLAGVHFTGSTTTFETLWKSVGDNIAQYKSYPRLVGETGGKDFVFAHSSADPDELVAGLVRGAFEYQGQKCSAASRAYIPSSVWTKIKDKLIHEIQSIKMGDPADFSNFMNAVIDARAFKKITSYIDDAKQSSDAKILCGGEYDDREGYFIRPTVIQALNPQYRSMVEEIFGPVLSVYVYEDNKEEEALRICDTSTPYALTGAIYSQDQQATARMNKALINSAGNFYINDKPTGAVVGQQPFGGARKSGTNDKAGSEWNLARWVSHRTVKENFIPVTDYRYEFLKES